MITRQILLDWIAQAEARLADSHLADSRVADPQKPSATIDEVVSAVQHQIVLDGSVELNRQAGRVIAMSAVAAFVDGIDDTAREPAQTHHATNSAAADQLDMDDLAVQIAGDLDLLGEVVAASRAKRESSPLTPELRQRLVSIATQRREAAPNSQQTVDSAKRPAIAPVKKESDVVSKRSANRRYAILAISAILAALVVGIALRWNRNAKQGPEIQQPSSEVANNDSSPLDNLPKTPTPNINPPRVDPTLNERAPMEPDSIAEAPNVAPDEGMPIPKPEQAPVPQPKLMSPRQDSIVNDPTVQDPAVQNSMDNDPGTPSEPIEKLQLPKSPVLIARFDDIHGVLLESHATSGRDPEQSVAATSVTTRSIGIDTPIRLTSAGSGSVGVPNADASADPRANDAGNRTLRTLPLSRAAGSIDGIGDCVIAADTRVDVGAAGDLQIVFGSLAFLDMVPGSTMTITQGDPSTRSVLTVDEQASVVMSRSSEGLNIEVSKGKIQYRDRTLVSGTHQVHQSDATIATLSESTPKTPAWVRRRVHRISLPKNILAQIGDSEDFGRSINQQLSTLSSRPASNATDKQRVLLASWFACANDGQLFRLLGIDDPMIRRAAMERMATVDPSDPRHPIIWQGVRRSVNDQRVYAQVYSLFKTLWAGRRPDAAQSQALLRMLQTQRVQSKVTADYLLRRFYGSGPTFDPNMNRQATTRVVNAWQQIINRSR